MHDNIVYLLIETEFTPYEQERVVGIFKNKEDAIQQGVNIGTSDNSVWKVVPVVTNNKKEEEWE